MPTLPTQERLDRLEARREQIRATTENMLLEARAAGRESLNAGETQRMDAALGDLRDLDHDIRELREDVDRSGIPEKIRNLGQQGRREPGSGRINCRPGSEVMPIDFGLEELRAAHGKVLRQEPCLLETRAPVSSASPLLPPQLFPVPSFPVHEGRIADRLAAFALDAPSLKYIQVNSVTGAAGVVAEGAAKPEIVLNTTKLTATVSKIAAHLGLSWESILDWDAFTASATTELQRLIIDEENAQILSWLDTTGILTHAATAAPVPPATTFDDIEQAIAKLRVGPSLATADLLITNPATWSAVRRQKDQYGRYLVAPDPSRGEVDSAWGVPVLVTTACPDGEGWLLDTTKLGRLAVRETLALRIGYSGTDFVQNVLRYVCEERCVLTVERPSAVLHVTTLPTTLATESKAKSSKK